MHEQIAFQYAPGDDLPCADASLLAPLKKSPEYRAIRPRVASPRAVDSWQDQGVHFFVFQLESLEGLAAVPGDPPVVVFAMHPEEPGPVSAVVVTPKPGGEEAEVVDLRQPESAYTAAYIGASAPAQASEPEHQNRGDADVENVSGDMPDVNLELLTAVKESQEFQAIQGRLVRSLPTDSWHEDGAHFFVFQLLPTDGSPSNGHEPPVAVFAMRPPEPMPISAVIVTPGINGEEPEITNLRQPDSIYGAPFSPMKDDYIPAEPKPATDE
jgi:hypothetical protein